MTREKYSSLVYQCVPTTKEDKQLIKAGIKYVIERDDFKIHRKRKSRQEAACMQMEYPIYGQMVLDMEA